MSLAEFCVVFSLAGRLKELEGYSLICKPGKKSRTTSGRFAYEYKLTEEGSKIDIQAYLPAPKPIKQQKSKSRFPENQQPLFSL